MNTQIQKKLLAIALFMWAGLAQAEALTIAIAANLKYAFDELAAEFKKETGIETQSVLNASGKIATQIRNGAPFDVFLSADMEFPDGLYKDGYAVTQAKPYAYGVLVLWTQKGIDLGKGVPVLAHQEVVKVAIANPKVAPFGKQALKALDYYKVREAVMPKLVYGENITQVGQYVDTKTVEVGFSSKSIVTAPEMAGKGSWVEVPAESHNPIAQGMVILKRGSEFHADEARQFYGFMLSAKARAILSKHGYNLP